MSTSKTLHLRSYRAHPGQRGVSVLEILIVFVILGIIISFALLGIGQIRSTFHLANNTDVLKGNLEKAFTDARRRHAQGDVRAKIQVTSPSTYDMTADFNNNGTIQVRTYRLDNNVRFVYDPAAPPTATVDWRGNIAEGSVAFVLRSPNNETTTLNLTSTGDAIENTDLPAMPVITATTTSADVKMTAVVNGNFVPNPNPSPTAWPTPLPYCSGNQKPFTDNCRCREGHTIDPKSGKCK